jgi:hypothetical protein
MVEPEVYLKRASEASVRAVIEQTVHDELFGGEDQSKADTRQIERRILQRLRANPALAGFEFRSIIITVRQGDERRIQIAGEAKVEKTRIFEEEQIEQARITRAIALATRQAELERQKRELITEETQTLRYRQIASAKIDVDKRLMLLRVKAEEQDLALKLAIQSQKFELVQQLIPAQTEVLREIAKAVQMYGLLDGRRRRLEVGGFDLTAILNRNMKNLYNAVQELDQQQLPLDMPGMYYEPFPQDPPEWPPEHKGNNRPAGTTRIA